MVWSQTGVRSFNSCQVINDLISVIKHKHLSRGCTEFFTSVMYKLIYLWGCNHEQVKLRCRFMKVLFQTYDWIQIISLKTSWQWFTIEGIKHAPEYHYRHLNLDIVTNCLHFMISLPLTKNKPSNFCTFQSIVVKSIKFTVFNCKFCTVSFPVM